MAGRTIVVGDVHGMAGLLRALLAAVAPADGDEVVFLGDLIDRGDRAREVLDLVVGLGRERRVTCLQGNHEAMLLAARSDARCLSWLGHGGLATVASYAPDVAAACRQLMGGPLAHREVFPLGPFFSAMPEAHLALLASTSLWLRRGEWLLVHGGVDPALERPEESRRRTLLEGHPRFPKDYSGPTRIVFGHMFSGRLRGDGQPLPFASANGRVLGLDVGSSESGRLAAFVLEEDRVCIVSDAEPLWVKPDGR